MQLSTNGNKLFSAIYQLQRNNLVYLHYNKIRPLTVLSLEQVKDAQKELIQKKVIKPTSNPFEFKVLL